MYKRTDRVSQQVKEELAVIFLNEIRDPRIGMVTVTDVRMSDDLSIAKVYLVAVGARALSPEALQGLAQAKGFIKRELSQRLKLRRLPDLLFFNDEVFVRGGRIEEIFANINDEEKIDCSGTS